MWWFSSTSVNTAWCMCPCSVPPATSRKSNSIVFPSAEVLAAMRGRFPASQKCVSSKRPSSRYSMVIGSSLAGSSGVPGFFISCTRAFPRDVTRSETQPSPPMPACGGSTLSAPFQVPARLFSRAKDISALDFCAADCAETATTATVESAPISIAVSAKRTDFMVVLLKVKFVGGVAPPRRHTVISNYNTKTARCKHSFLPFGGGPRGPSDGLPACGFRLPGLLVRWGTVCGFVPLPADLDLELSEVGPVESQAQARSQKAEP